MNKDNKTQKQIEQLFVSVREDVKVPSYGTFYSRMQSVTKPTEARNTVRGWKLIPSLRMVVGIVFVSVLMLPVIYSHKASETDPLLVTISDEGTQEIENLVHEDELISDILNRYLQQLETING